jgi:RNA polymerase sigma-70 factor, ECF subfamily
VSTLQLSTCAPGCARLCTADGMADAYARFADQLTGLGHRQLGDRGLAEEITQEVFVRAWRSCGMFTGVLGQLRTWLFAIARNAIVDAARARGRRPVTAPPDAALHVADPVDHVETLHTTWQVRSALRRVSDDHRDVVTAVFLRGDSYADAATALGIPLGTLKSRMYYALRALRTALDT